MNYLKRNSLLLKSYLYILISNIIIYILSSFYFKSLEYGSIIMFFILIIINTIIYFKNKDIKFKLYLDIITNIIVGFILMLFIKNELVYSTTIFTIFFANNIIFMISRKDVKILKRGFQYINILLSTFFSMLINLLVFISI